MIYILAICNIKVRHYNPVQKEIKISVKVIYFLKKKPQINIDVFMQNMGRWNNVHFNKHTQLISLNQSYVLVSSSIP